MKVINFTRIRFYTFALSFILIVGGLVGMLALGGFNLGIDFQAGLSQRIQIANTGISLTYTGADDMTLDVINGDVVITVRNDKGVSTKTFTKEAYSTAGALVDGLNTMVGVQAVVVGNSDSPCADIVTGLSLPYTVAGTPVYLNFANTDNDKFVTINNVREALSSMHVAQVQVVGDDYLQEFQIRAETDTEGTKETLEASIVSLLRDTFGENNVVIKGSDYVGPKFSAALSSSSILLVIIALSMIMIYIWYRFKFAYAISAIAALLHDVLFMLGFIAVMRLEVSTTTIAAVLTIIGYSLNDTIVVFDRIRENIKGMKGRPDEVVINTSITQSLSRTIITSLTTLLAVIPLYFFATGSIKLFALNMIVGVIVGTYSSIFIASPILLGIMRRMQARSNKHLGIAESQKDKSEIAEAAPLTLVEEEVEIEYADRKKHGKRKTKK